MKPPLELQNLWQIQRKIRFLLKNRPRIDKESLAVELWQRQWERGNKPLSWKEIRHRCLDEVKTHNMSHTKIIDEAAAEQLFYQEQRQDLETKLSNIEAVDTLIASTPMTSADRRFIYQRFYLNQSDQEIGFLLKMTTKKVTQKIDEILDRMRQQARRNQTRAKGLKTATQEEFLQRGHQND